MEGNGDSALPNISTNEEKELSRVFNTLAAFQQKSRIESALAPKKLRRDKLLAHKKSPESMTIEDACGEAMSDEEVNREYEALRLEIASLEKEMSAYDADPNRKIKAGDLSECLKALGKQTSKKEIEDMIWEVDENLDGVVDWEEFKLTYQRNLADTTGLEPSQLFNVIQFMLYDKDGSGRVTVDETMHMLYTRYGRDKLEGQVKMLFGEDLATEDGDGELSFTEYIVALRKSHKGTKKDLH